MSTSEKSRTGTVTARGRVPDFFIVGQPQGRHDRALRDARPASADLHVRPQGAALPGGRPALSFHQSARTAASADARGIPFTVCRGGRGPARRRGHARCTCGRARRPSGFHSCSRRRGSSRSCASRPACLRSLHLQFLRSHVESEGDLGRALALEAERREGRQIPRRSHLPQLLQYSEHVRYARAAASVPRSLPPRAGPGPDLRRLPRRQRRARCARCCASSTCPRTIRSSRSAPTRRTRRCAPSRSTTWCSPSPSAARSVARASRRDAEALAPRAGAPEGVEARSPACGPRPRGASRMPS